MRIALIADVHGNLPALQAVIADASLKKVDEYWSLGDMVGYGPYPNEVIDLLRQTCSCHVSGNYDSKCISPEHALRMKASGKDKDKIFSFEWTLGVLSAENQAFIKDLPECCHADVEGVGIMLVHGSSQGIDDILTPRSAIKKFTALANDAVQQKVRAVAFGHTHEFVDRLVEGVRFINPGGVGRSFDGDIRASYCIADISREGIMIEHYRLEYPVDVLVDMMHRQGFPERLIRALTEARSLEEIDGLKRETVEGLSVAAIELGKNLRAKMDHSIHVARLALRMFDDLAGYYGLGWRERALLSAAALLHDIGWIYGQESHHKASRDLVLKDATLPLNTRERTMVALIARYHRRSVPEGAHKFYKDLSPYEKELVDLLSAFLRMADGLDRTHAARVSDVAVSIGRVRMTIAVSARPGEDISAELKAAKEKSDLLRSIYGPNILIKKSLPCT